MDLLPEDVLADVLSRLPPRAVAVSRGVCRGWRAAADADARCQHQLSSAANLLPITLAGIFVQTNEPETPSFFVRPSMAHRIAGDLEHYVVMDIGYPIPGTYDEPEINDCCNGLLLLEDHVVNPATGKWARLPPYDPDLPEEHVQDTDHHPFLVFDPMVSPHYEVVAMKYPPRGMDKLPMGQQWPPPVYVARVYSSRTDRWEERPFVREEGATGTVSNVELDSELWRTSTYHGAYWHGALYVSWSDCITRITLSNDKYKVINLPTGVHATSKYYQLCLGKSKNGVHFAVLDKHRLQVWFLDETGGNMEWVLKHSANLLTLKLPEHTDRPWISQDGNYNQKSKRPSVLEKELDWHSDDDNAVDIEKYGGKRSYLNVDVFGFHPYREIIFLFTDDKMVMAYYFNSSKIQNLGRLHIRHRYHYIERTFIYTPCWVGELPENM
ncbi:unnamed protein product [Urochloa decumbens]|uniref:F-box domain-containing protein n=1 Tax=Urochloa decumbens TaxID=240449 RepID=A0ABC8Y2V6_9POAL